jgi:predicted aspartyl protease
MKKNGEKIPEPISGQALVDTGATFSAIDEGIADKLGVKPIGLAPSGTAGGEVMLNIYAARFILPLNIQVGFSRATGVRLAGQQYIALIGRDVLSQMILVYNGPAGLISLAL